MPDVPVFYFISTIEAHRDVFRQITRVGPFSDFYGVDWVGPFSDFYGVDWVWSF